MATTELEKVIKKLGITIKANEQPGTPSRGFPPGLTLWRVTLERTFRGEEKPVRLTLSLFSAEEPTPEQVLTSIQEDLEAGELSLWDFAQAFNSGKTDAAAERAHKASKRLAPRANRFFGDSWHKVSASLSSAA